MGSFGGQVHHSVMGHANSDLGNSSSQCFDLAVQIDFALGI